MMGLLLKENCVKTLASIHSFVLSIRIKELLVTELTIMLFFLND